MTDERDPLERLIMDPTPTEQRAIDLREQLGCALVATDEARLERLYEERLRKRIEDRTAQLERQLLEKQAELGGLRLVMSEILTSEQMWVINIRCYELAAEEG